MQSSLNFIPRSVNKRCKTGSTSSNRSHESSRVKRVKQTKEHANLITENKQLNHDKTTTILQNEFTRAIPIGHEHHSSKQIDERTNKANNLVHSSTQFVYGDREGNESTPCTASNTGLDRSIQRRPKQESSHTSVLNAIENQACPPYRDIGCLSPRKHIAVYQRGRMNQTTNRGELQQKRREEYRYHHQSDDCQTPHSSCHSYSQKYPVSHDINMGYTFQQYPYQYYPNVSWTPEYYYGSARIEQNYKRSAGIEQNYQGRAWIEQNYGRSATNEQTYERSSRNEQIYERSSRKEQTYERSGKIGKNYEKSSRNNQTYEMSSKNEQTYERSAKIEQNCERSSRNEQTYQGSARNEKTYERSEQNYQDHTRTRTTEDSISRRHTMREENLARIGREWEYTSFGHSYLKHSSRRHCDKFDFTVMSYNVLAQNLLEDNSYLYSHCPRHVLDWSHRKTAILKEIDDHRPDVLCLQEVYASHFEDFFTPELHKLGYAGEFVKRTGDKEDGCATFYKQHQFSLDKAITIHYKNPKGGEVLDRDNVALIMKLIPKMKTTSKSDHHSDTPRRLCISNTHLLFNPRRGDVKLAQLMILLAELDKCGHLKDGQNRDSYHGLIMCGDFNLAPYSELYQLLAMGRLDYVGLPRKYMSGQGFEDYGYSSGPKLDRYFLPSAVGINDNCQYCEVADERNKDGGDSDDDCKVITNVQGTGILSHQLKLLSAYKHRVGRYDWEVTTQHRRANCTVDYIFYGIESGETSLRDNMIRVRNIREGPLRLVGRYSLLTGHELEQMGSLPNKHIGSDHLCLMARFVLT